MKQVDHGYRLPPPPGCPKAMYELMIHCWWVSVDIATTNGRTLQQDPSPRHLQATDCPIDPFLSPHLYTTQAPWDVWASYICCNPADSLSPGLTSPAVEWGWQGWTPGGSHAGGWARGSHRPLPKTAAKLPPWQRLWDCWLTTQITMDFVCSLKSLFF